MTRIGKFQHRDIGWGVSFLGDVRWDGIGMGMMCDV